MSLEEGHPHLLTAGVPVTPAAAAVSAERPWDKRGCGVGESSRASSEGTSKLLQSLFDDKSVVLTKQPIFPSLTPSLSALRYRSVG